MAPSYPRSPSVSSTGKTRGSLAISLSHSLEIRSPNKPHRGRDYRRASARPFGEHEPWQYPSFPAADIRDAKIEKFITAIDTCSRTAGGRWGRSSIRIIPQALGTQYRLNRCLDELSQVRSSGCMDGVKRPTHHRRYLIGEPNGLP